MEDEEKVNNKVDNKLKIIITILSIISIVVISIIIVYFVKQTKAATVGAFEQQNIEQNDANNNEVIKESIDIEELKSIENKDEEELNETNEKETETETKKTNTTKNKYYIKVNYGAQVVNIYTYDENGNYTVPVKAFICSTGTATPTSGVYKIPAKVEWCRMYGYVYGHYCTQIVGDILFHSVPYLEKNNYTLEYWEYDKLGTRASMGCIRMTTADAKWIFNNVSCGTQVEFYSSSNPGPLGKPTAQKISDAPEELRGWDPTDPDPSNPWLTYKPEEDSGNTNEEQNQVNNDVTNDITNSENNVIENTETNNTVEENTTNDVTGNEQVDNIISNEQTNSTQDNTIKDDEIDDKENTDSNNGQEDSDINDSKENDDDISDSKENSSTNNGEETEEDKKQEDTTDQ